MAKADQASRRGGVDVSGNDRPAVGSGETLWPAEVAGDFPGRPPDPIGLSGPCQPESPLLAHRHRNIGTTRTPTGRKSEISVPPFRGPLTGRRVGRRHSVPRRRPRPSTDGNYAPPTNVRPPHEAERDGFSPGEGAVLPLVEGGPAGLSPGRGMLRKMGDICSGIERRSVDCDEPEGEWGA